MYTHTCSNTHKKIKIILQSNYIPGHKRTRMYDVHNNTSSKSTVYIPEHKRTRMYTCILRIYMHTHAQTIIEIKKNGSFEPPLGAVVSLHERDPETLERFESSASIVKWKTWAVETKFKGSSFVLSHHQVQQMGSLVETNDLDRRVREKLRGYRVWQEQYIK